MRIVDAPTLLLTAACDPSGPSSCSDPIKVLEAHLHYAIRSNIHKLSRLRAGRPPPNLYCVENLDVFRPDLDTYLSGKMMWHANEKVISLRRFNHVLLLFCNACGLPRPRVAWGPA